MIVCSIGAAFALAGLLIAAIAAIRTNARVHRTSTKLSTLPSPAVIHAEVARLNNALAQCAAQISRAQTAIARINAIVAMIRGRS